MASEDLAYLSATELLDLITSGQVSPVELAELYCMRIGRLDPHRPRSNDGAASPRRPATRPTG